MILSSHEKKENSQTAHNRGVSRNLSSICNGTSRGSHRRCSVRKGVLRNFTKSTGNTCVRPKVPDLRPGVSGRLLLSFFTNQWSFTKKKKKKKLLTTTSTLF